MKHQGKLATIVLLANLALAFLMYLTIGWHYIRGYNEVGNFVIVTFVAMQAVLNIVLAAAIAVVMMARKMRIAPFLLASLCLSAAILSASLKFAPVLGTAANQRLWLRTPLVQAARYADTELVITLVTNGVDPNVKEHHLERTALHFMAGRGENEAVRVLLENGADPNARTGGRWQTPLHWAFRSYGDATSVELLLKHGADPSLLDLSQRTPVYYADRNVYPFRVETLEEMKKAIVTGSPANRK